jgi:hypothetical protein
MNSNKTDITEQFQRYRAAVSIIWNVFLNGCQDQEIDFVDVDRVLLSALLGADAEASAIVKTKGARVFSPIAVKAPEKEVLVLKHQAGTNRWERAQLPQYASLRYMKLFDWNSFSGSYRDFEFLRCRVESDAGELRSGDDILVQARTAQVFRIS